ncbi:hypothetical protein [Sphingopyxis witflariensis]|uniref:Uncharacterized protein n=1 Tax=Sphingopyxis witflariensis TaxID=173675 RepID=A0A246K4X1_9SPHN|nr:hypothetical protein [Sphingopyxis witflariensis]OWR00068.1 hypothetical protein CDQ91_04625 [Sphingopyxis witflariensis]
MGEPKPLASLSAGLLARKGGARPAMRRQPLGSGPVSMSGTGYDDLGWNDMGYDVDPDQSGEPAQMLDLKPLLTGSVLAHNVEAEQAVEEGVGGELTQLVEPTEIMGVDADYVAEAPAIPEIVRQQESLIDRVAAVARKVEARPAPKTPKAKAPRTLRAREKAAFTLRLDAERHLRLRLASAVTNRSSQLILIDLLDEYLASLPEIDAMASRLPAVRPPRRTAQG